MIRIKSLQFTQKVVLNKRGKELNSIDYSKNPIDYRKMFLPLTQVNIKSALAFMVAFIYLPSQSNYNTKHHG